MSVTGARREQDVSETQEKMSVMQARRERDVSVRCMDTYVHMYFTYVRLDYIYVQK